MFSVAHITQVGVSGPKKNLTKVADLCQKHGVLLVSDEIHQDLALYGNKHISMNTISDAYKDFTLVLSSATKTFNIAVPKQFYYH